MASQEQSQETPEQQDPHQSSHVQQTPEQQDPEQENRERIAEPRRDIQRQKEFQEGRAGVEFRPMQPTRITPSRSTSSSGSPTTLARSSRCARRSALGSSPPPGSKAAHCRTTMPSRSPSARTSTPRPRASPTPRSDGGDHAWPFTAVTSAARSSPTARRSLPPTTPPPHAHRRTSRAPTRKVTIDGQKDKSAEQTRPAPLTTL